MTHHVFDPLQAALLPVGYFAKNTEVPPAWQSNPAVKEICSISHCIAPAPDGWIDHWIHNEFGFFDSPSKALSVTPAGAKPGSLFAYRMLAVRFAITGAVPLAIPAFPIEPLPPGFASLGYDIVSKSISAFFECSPLSCNLLASEVPVNSFCLVDTLPDAVALALGCAREEPEPGPYYVFEVLR